MKRPFFILGSTLWLLALAFAFLPSWPHIYYRLSPQTSQSLAQTISTTTQPAQDGSEPVPEQSEEQLFVTFGGPQLATPSLDPSLPKENGLIIKTIGVRGKIHQGENWQEILKNGIWQVPGFGTPEDNSQPIILAAHRWGYLNWTNQFRYLNSFYNLPKLNIEDKITINWNQRQYIYKVYQEEISEQITNYSADLILYTCQLWNSPLRIIKYANLTN
ncbi:sortase [Patescibacteria group bacterium]|nr:sortase [Patescibacteria group bacterium]MBU1256134.1 sortase [Patescibacteria group bacterium]MBU1457891.1 sortase [Patescibacteria group bacterium]